jgi:hypothetical protein
MLRPVISALALLALAGCASTSERFPSLSIRPGEKTETAEEGTPAAPAVASTVSSAGAQRLQAIAARIDQANTTFDTTAASARIVVARSGPAGSETWVAAQEALSTLSTANADLATAINDLDDLSRDLVTSAAPSASAELTAASELTARAVALQSAQAATFATLTAQVAQP